MLVSIGAALSHPLRHVDRFYTLTAHHGWFGALAAQALISVISVAYFAGGTELPTRWPTVALYVLLAHAALLWLLGLGLQQARPLGYTLVAVQLLPLSALLAQAAHQPASKPEHLPAQPPAQRSAPAPSALGTQPHSTPAPAEPRHDPSTEPAPQPAFAPAAAPYPAPSYAAAPASSSSLGATQADSGSGPSRLGASPPGLESAAGQAGAPGSDGTPAAAATVELVLPSAAARHLHNPTPPYPALSRRLGEQGRVLLRVRIETDGRAAQVLLYQSSGFARLDQAALQTVPHWRFVPGTRNGVPAAMWFQVPIQFVLE